jgi:soluble lytic murein transglycosylase-like protein
LHVVQVPKQNSIDEIVNAAGDQHNIDPDFINSVIHAESGFNPRAVSPKGARGLMQLMPQTATQLGVKNSFDAGANVEGGTRYLRELLERYNFDMVKALAAYNAGPQRVDRYHGVPPYYETQAYIARIVRDFNRKKLAEKKTAAKARKLAASKPGNSGKSSRKGLARQSSSLATANSSQTSQVSRGN